MFKSCPNCPFRLKSKGDAVRILSHLMEVATLHEAEDGGTVIQAKLNLEHVMKLCTWGSECVDCEDNCDCEADKIEAESQFEAAQ